MIFATSSRLITAPETEIITLAEAKAHLNVSHSADDAYITALITTARERIEMTTNRALITQTWRAFYPCFGRWVVPSPILQSVTHIKYYVDTAPTVAVTLASTEYEIDSELTPAEIGLAYGKSWPSVTLRSSSGVEIQFVSGYSAASAVPKSIKQAALLMIGHWYLNREETTSGTAIMREIPIGAERLLDNYRALGTR